MSKTSKSPKAILEQAYAVAKEVLPEYSNRFSPQTFTQPQLFACLILKAYLQTDYRGIEGFLEDVPDLRSVIGMSKTPHFTTLQKAEKRLLDKAKTRKLLQETLRRTLTPTQRKRIIELAAMDGTGFESRHVSDYFLKRQNLSGNAIWHRKYPKIGIIADCSNHMILAVSTGRGPSPDIFHFTELLTEAARNGILKIKTLLADAGYDSERSHQIARTDFNIRSIIPAKIGRPTTKLPKGKWRKLMATRFEEEKYAQRWQVETVFSMMKRRLGTALKARRYHSQCRELHLRAVCLNIMILAVVTLLLLLK